MKPTIFLSYASEDYATVKRIHDALNQLDCDPWMDTDRLEPGNPFASKIYTAITERRFFIACLSHNSADKVSFVQREFALAVRHIKTVSEGQFIIIPLIIERCQIPLIFSDFLWLDWREKDALIRLMMVLRPEDRETFDCLHKLVRATNQGSQQQRAKAILKIAAQKNSLAFLTLNEWYYHEQDATVRYWIARGIGTFGTQRALESLHKLRERESTQKTNADAPDGSPFDLVLEGINEGMTACQALLGKAGGGK